MRARPKAEQHAQDAPGDGEQDAFGEELADDAGAAGSQGGADGKLALAAGGAHQQQVGHVGAGDQQHQADGAQQHEQRFAGVADDRVAQRRSRRILVGSVGKVTAVLGPAATSIARWPGPE